ncbi:machado-joseph disease protein, putative [Eimeria mitis]|uniref:Machado-joseph disease protein, putative n=1 Tax=Eimeria mitis TaxID=44415 RepID=U6K957_9EIME|nr:machado-joseph disease protein, putative [Eimeria mitis]CDJ34474.1 machado-joseph disease protein, putative [Eimeria mitis]
MSRLNGSSSSSSSSAAAAGAAAAAAAAAAADDPQTLNPSDDPELLEAIRLSRECYKKELAAPAAEPPETEEGVIRVSIRTPSGGRINRRFRPNENIKQISVWLFFVSDETTDLPPLSPFSSFSLVQTFPRRRFCFADGRVLLFSPEQQEGLDVSEDTLLSLGFQSHEQLMMQLS